MQYYIDNNYLCQQIIDKICLYNLNMELILGQRLRALRKEKGLKQSELAQALNVTQRKISYWETGQLEPDLQTLWELSDYFEVSVDYLIGKADI